MVAQATRAVVAGFGIPPGPRSMVTPNSSFVPVLGLVTGWQAGGSLQVLGEFIGRQPSELYSASLSTSFQQVGWLPLVTHDGISWMEVVPSAFCVTSSTTQSGLSLLVTG